MSTQWNSICKYCGEKATDKYAFCPACWKRLCGERMEMIIIVGSEHGYECEHFQHAVETAVLYLKWLDERDEPPRKKPVYDPNDDDWWKK